MGGGTATGGRLTWLPGVGMKDDDGNTYRNVVPSGGAFLGVQIKPAPDDKYGLAKDGFTAKEIQNMSVEQYRYYRDRLMRMTVGEAREMIDDRPIPDTANQTIARWELEKAERARTDKAAIDAALKAHTAKADTTFEVRNYQRDIMRKHAAEFEAMWKDPYHETHKSHITSTFADSFKPDYHEKVARQVAELERKSDPNWWYPDDGLGWSFHRVKRDGKTMIDCYWKRSVNPDAPVWSYLAHGSQDFR